MCREENMKAGKKKPAPRSKMERVRLWIKTLASNAFAAPYLPVAMTVFFIITAITNLAILLMSQPLSYWHSGSAAKGLAVAGEALEIGPVAMIGGWLVYMAIGVLCLSVVNTRWSLIGWLTAEIMHLYAIQYVLQDCHLSRWSVWLGALCQSFDEGGFWFFVAILLGILLTIYFRPADLVFTNKKIGERITRGIALAPIAWILILIGGVFWSAQKPTFGWVPVETEDKPGPLQEAKAAYDTKRSRLVMFGGAASFLGNDRWDFRNDTWEWDGSNWINVSPKESPEGRTKPGMAYDENRGVVVMFGGVGRDGLLCDTWEWDGKKWAQICPSDCPSARFGHEMFYDPVLKKVVLYGGYDRSTFYNDAWEWDGHNWSKIELEGEAPVASVFALAYNPDKQYAFTLLSGHPGGTWTFKEDTWTRLTPEMEPSNRGWTTLVYVPDRKLFVTFGGVSKDTVLNDTWLFNGKNWELFTKSSFQPSVRSDMVIWYDRVRKHVMLFGGHNGPDVYNDTWELILPDE
jgi:hypothetical protein